MSADRPARPRRPPRPETRFIVERHGGASTHRWRLVGASAEPENAGELFHRVAAAMRQGGVRVMRRIIDERGRDIEPPVEVYSQWAPRLRSRW